MAIRKDKSAAAREKPAAAPPTPRPSSAQVTPTPPRGASPQQIIREAAWSRMFGRAEMKNPFTR